MFKWPGSCVLVMIEVKSFLGFFRPDILGCLILVAFFAWPPCLPTDTIEKPTWASDAPIIQGLGEPSLGSPCLFIFHTPLKFNHCAQCIHLTLGPGLSPLQRPQKSLLWDEASTLRIKNWVVVLAVPITNDVTLEVTFSLWASSVKKIDLRSSLLKPLWKFETSLNADYWVLIWWHLFTNITVLS